MILLNPVVEIAAGPMPRTAAEFGLDRLWVAVVPRAGVMAVTVLAERKKALAAAMSRVSLSLTSTSAPAASMAR